MIIDIEANNDNKTIIDKEIAILKKHFPACFSKDGSFDIVRFKEAINEKVDITKEGYELKFLGKSYAKLLASLDTTTVISPNLEHNNLPVNKESKNIYISGDNLDGLKHLLKSYANKVKCIYIDPPYNTGKDGFAYNDNFNFTLDNLQHRLSVDEDEAQRILNLTKSGSASHSAWLLFMYPRLQLAKDLISDNGAIFISINDNEHANLKLLCDDLFGEENLISDLIWANKEGGGSSDSSHFKIKHEHILCYSRKLDSLEISGVDISNRDRYKEDDKHLKVRGPYYLQKMGMGSIQYSESLDYEILSPDNTSIFPKDNNKGKRACWRWSKPKYEWGIKNDFIVIKKDSKDVWTVYTKQYLNCDNEGNLIIREQRPFALIDNYSSTQASKHLDTLELGEYFSYSKPYQLIEYIIERICFKDDLILDFFSGSGTTAEAVIKLNSKDEGERKIISIQIPQVLDLKNKKQKQVFDFLKSINRPATLDYVGIERIIRASKKIKEKTKSNIDYGFKHYILNEPEQNTLDKCETFDKASLIPDGSILEDFGEETVLTTWLNYDGYGLNVNAQVIDLNGYTGYYYDKHLYLINPDFTKENVVALFEKYEAIGDFNPENVILFGYSFNEWSVTEMLEQNLKILNDTEKNLKININVRY